MQILRSCQHTEHVLGGSILYHNKLVFKIFDDKIVVTIFLIHNNRVLATQLGSSITKQLVLTDPYRIKSPAETIKTDFELPIGVQLLQVHISRSDYNNFLDDARKLRHSNECLNDWKMKSVSFIDVLFVLGGEYNFYIRKCEIIFENKYCSLYIKLS